MSAGEYSPGIDLIVVNYRTSADLGHFIASYRKHKPDVPNSLVIGNVDPLQEDREVAEKSGYSFLEWDTNVGYAHAVNFASTLRGSEVIGIFNADTRLTENVVNDCYNALVSNESWGVLGPRQIDDFGRVTHGGIFGQERGFHHRNSEQYSDVRDDATTVSGSAYFVKRSVWDELTECPIYRNEYPDVLGAFLPTRHYYEEAWASYHARSHGHKVVYYGASTMIHAWHKASPRGGPMDRQIPEAREMFERMCDCHDIDYK